MSKLTSDLVKEIGEIARIAITDEEAQQYAAQLEGVLVQADQLQEVNTDNIQPTTHGIVLTMKNVMREDEPHNGLTEEEAFKNAPEPSEDGQFRVPSILE